MQLLHTQHSESLPGSKTSVEPRRLSNSNTLGQRTVELKASEDKDLHFMSPKTSLPASPVRKVKLHCPSATVPRGSPKISTGMKARPSNIRRYRGRLHGVRKSFVGWLNQPGRCKVSPKSDIFKVAQPQKLLSDLANSISQLEATTEPAKPYDTLESTMVVDSPASSAQFDNEGHDTDRVIGGPTISMSRIDDSPTNDTQISLCDSAFESQASLHARTKTESEHLQYRKDAYRAARGRSGLGWEDNHGLISASGGHGTEETEL